MISAPPMGLRCADESWVMPAVFDTEYSLSGGWTLQESVRRHETIQFREPVLAHLDLRLSARCPGCWFSRSDTNETRPAGDHCDFSYGGKPLALICEAGLMLQVMRPMPRAADENLSRHRGRKNRR